MSDRHSLSVMFESLSVRSNHCPFRGPWDQRRSKALRIRLYLQCIYNHHQNDLCEPAEAAKMQGRKKPHPNAGKMCFSDGFPALHR